MNLRPHHLLCLLGFQGYGYSQPFVDNLLSIFNAILNNPDIQITIKVGCDDICAFCPHLQNNICLRDNSSEKNVLQMDHQVLSLINIAAGNKFPASQIFLILKQKLSQRDVTKNICGLCQWKNVCNVNQKKSKLLNFQGDTHEC